MITYYKNQKDKSNKEIQTTHRNVEHLYAWEEMNDAKTTIAIMQNKNCDLF